MKELKSFFTKKKNIGFVLLIGLFAVGSMIATTRNNIPLHDGDILVDSQNVTTEDTEGTQDNNKTYESESLTELRASIELERNNLLDTYNQIINSSENKSEIKASTKERDELLQIMKQETEIENQIKTKSIPEALVLITDSSVNVTVSTDKLEQNEASSICHIVMKATDRPASEIIVNTVGQ